MSCDKSHICTVCGKPFEESELFMCGNCGEYLCPNDGGEIVTIEEYEKAMKENSNDN